MRVLFVCTANICRSAYAELMTRHLLGADTAVEVRSAGTHGFRDHPVDPPTAAQLRVRGVDPEGFRSRRLSPRMVAEADLVLTAGVVHRQFVLDDWPEAFRRVLTLGQLARAVEAAEVGSGPSPVSSPSLDELSDRLRPADHADDVEDPYRRGAEVAARVAGRLDALLGQVAPLLR